MKRIIIILVIFAMSCQDSNIKPSITGVWIGEKQATDNGAIIDGLFGVWTLDIVQNDNIITWVSGTYQLIGNGYESSVYAYRLNDGYIEDNYIQMFFDNNKDIDAAHYKAFAWKGFIKGDQMELDLFTRDDNVEKIRYENIIFAKQ